MSSQLTIFKGGCMCGAVRYQAQGTPVSVIYCHCESCRRHTGAPVVACAGFKREQVSFSGHERATYASSPGVQRGFCADCGTPLTWEGDGEELGPLIEIFLGTSDDPSQLVPQYHVHVGEELPWLRNADKLPHYQQWETEYLPLPDVDKPGKI